jgi:ferrous iron transport protein B
MGCPNVGKSVLFCCLTGVYANVSNYPGTTVEVCRGKMSIETDEFEVIDTPGAYSLAPITEEERVARKILLDETPDIVLHVVDAKNLERMLPFTLQLVEAGVPLLLVLNMIDEAESAGIKIHAELLEKELNIPVVLTASTTGRGILPLKEKIAKFVPQKLARNITYALNNSIERIERLIESHYGISKRAVAILLLQNDREICSWVEAKEPKIWGQIQSEMIAAKAQSAEPLAYLFALERQTEAIRIARMAVEHVAGSSTPFKERLSRFLIHPLTGLPVLLLVLYLGLYKFVGQLGAGVLVNLIEKNLFEKIINPWFVAMFNSWIPWKPLCDLFVGEYGFITLGIRYAVALILPIVTTFFIAFAIIEDSGYLPRLALLIDRLFKLIGLSGRAVIPMVLGLGCGTMATMVTRTLPSKRERLISTILLALAVPCSAQLGVIFSLLYGHPAELLVWGGVLVLVFLLIGFLSSKILTGGPPSFYMELPPLRWPKVSNVLIKTLTRVQWYFVEVFPMFLLASVMIWVGQITGLFNILTATLEHPVRAIGLPDEAAIAFLFGFFRRDYGAGGLYDLKQAGLLDGNQLVVASVAITLFLPCIAQFLMTAKERGWKIGAMISIFVLLFAFSTAFVLNLILNLSGVRL